MWTKFGNPELERHSLTKDDKSGIGRLVAAELVVSSLDIVSEERSIMMLNILKILEDVMIYVIWILNRKMRRQG